MITYQCKYKNSKILQKYIFEHHDIHWGHWSRNRKTILDFNLIRKDNGGELINDNENIRIYLDKYLSFDSGTRYTDPESLIDFELLLRKEKFKRLND